MRARSLAILLLLPLGIGGGCESARPTAVESGANGDWVAYGRTQLGDRHSPLDQITRTNVTRLQVAWRFRTGETAARFATHAPTALEATPLVVDGAMYLSTPWDASSA